MVVDSRNVQNKRTILLFATTKCLTIVTTLKNM